MPNITKYFSTLMNISGCVGEISQSVVTHKFGNIGIVFVKFFLEAEANCTPNRPFNMFLVPLLKEYFCIVASPPTTL
ncbi:hypothetical protein N665_0084s0018 [Sinapis alba]|nr:hypothetical protein N665_0084s0018 [Sinapis alba]